MTHKATEQEVIETDDIMPFGKYAEHYTARAVLADDPGYLRWIADTSYQYCLCDELEEALESTELRLELIDDANF